MFGRYLLIPVGFYRYLWQFVADSDILFSIIVPARCVKSRRVIGYTSIGFEQPVDESFNENHLVLVGGRNKYVSKKNCFDNTFLSYCIFPVAINL